MRRDRRIRIKTAWKTLLLALELEEGDADFPWGFRSSGGPQTCEVIIWGPFKVLNLW